MLPKNRKNHNCIDGIAKKCPQVEFFDFPMAQYAKKYKNSSTLFFKGGRTKHSFAGNPGFYSIYAGDPRFRIFDSAVAENFQGISAICRRNASLEMYLDIQKRYENLTAYSKDFFSGSVRGLSAARMWNLSIVGSVIFGMFTMTMIYRYLGQSVSAKMQKDADESNVSYEYEADKKIEEDINNEIDHSFITKLLEDYEKYEKNGEEKKLEESIREMVKGYPIEKMVPEIAKRDRIIAAFLVSIARKESAWGKRVPVLNGQDCYNYWGYRGIRDKMGSGGHTCFDSPKDAVDTVAKRIEFLVSNEKLNTPAKMKIWKCGYDCSWDNAQSVQKWIDDVGFYFKKLNKDDSDLIGKKPEISRGAIATAIVGQ